MKSPVSMRAHDTPALVAVAIVIFVAALAVIATRAGGPHEGRARSGAVLVVLTQTIDQEHAIEAIDWETIGLLAG